MSGSTIEVPAAFWQSMSRKRFAKVVARGGLGSAECERLWLHLRRPDKPPSFLRIVVRPLETGEAP